MKRFSTALFLLLVLSVFCFAQENEAEETPAGPVSDDETSIVPASYIDVLFNDYMELEESLLNLDVIDISYRGLINKLMIRAQNEGRNDIVSRLEMLDFIIASRLAEQQLSVNPELELAAIREAEKRRVAQQKTKEAGELCRDITMISAAVSGVVFLASTISYEDFYQKYTETDSADQAAFYLFWWQIFETTSIASGFSTIGFSLASGILAAIF